MWDFDVTCRKCGSDVSYIGYDRSDVYKCQNCGNVDEVGLTDHVEEQWLDRSRIPSLDIVTAYNDSIPCYNHSFDAEVVVYHHPSRIQLLMSNTDIVTAIYVPTGRRSARRSAIAAMIREDVSTEKIATLCNECGVDRAELEQIVDNVRTDRGKGSASGANAPGQNPYSRSEAY